MTTPSLRTTLIAAIGGGLAALSLGFAGPAAAERGADDGSGDTESTSQSDPAQEQALYDYIRSGAYGIAPPPGVTDTGADDLPPVESPDPGDPGGLGSPDRFGI